MHVEPEAGGFGAFLKRASTASSDVFEDVSERAGQVRDEVGDAISSMRDSVVSLVGGGSKKNNKSLDNMRKLQQRRMTAQKTGAPAPRISVFESYEYDPVRSRFRFAAEAAEPDDQLDHELLAESLMAGLVPLVMGASVGVLGVLSAEVAEYIVELRWEWAAGTLEEGAAGTAAGDGVGVHSSVLSHFNSWYRAYGGFVTGSMVLAGVAALATTYAPAAAGSGIPQVKAELNGVRVPGALSTLTLAVKLLGVTLAVASGLPAGREGPMVQIGAGVGNVVLHWHNKILALACCRSAHTEGRLLDEDRDVRDFVSMGAAAGVAAAFDAPIGGVLFAIEEVSTVWSAQLTWLSFFGALAAALTTQALKTDWVTGVVKDEGLFIVMNSSQDASYSVHELPLFVLLGACGGLLGALFNHLNGRVNKFRKRMFAQDGCACRLLGPRAVKVVEAAFLAWLVASFYFIVPSFYPCSSVLEAVAGGNENNGVDGSHWYFGRSEHRNASTSSVLKGAAAAAAMDEDAAHAAAELAEKFLVDFQCHEAPHHYNQVASITLSSAHKVIKALFTRHTLGVLFTAPALLLSLCLIFGLTVIVYGVLIPSGLFVPCMTMGALLGRCVGVLAWQYGGELFEDIDAGFYALVGAGAMLTGVTRMTISLTVILCEISNDAGSLLPLMVAIFAARFVGDLFNHSLFDMAMASAGYPFLEPHSERRFATLCAEDVMTSPVVCLREIDTADRVADVLRGTTHHAFPVIDPGHDGERKYLIGMVLRYQLEVMLRKRAFLPVEAEEAEEAKQLIGRVGISTDQLLDGDDGTASKRVLLARAAFTLMDNDGDGELSKHEMMSAYARDERVRRLIKPLLAIPNEEAGENIKEHVVAFENLFNAMDKDGSGGIEFDEFEKFFNPLHMAFRLMDSDGDGELTKAEMVSAFSRDERVRRLITPMLTLTKKKQMDIYNSADAVQQQIVAFENLFNAMDKDGSGGIEFEEFEKFFGDTQTSMKNAGPAAAAAAAESLVSESVSMLDFVAARNDARDKPPQLRLTASDAPLLMGNSDGARKLDLRPMMELAPHSVMHTMPLPRLHHSVRTLGLRHVFVTDTRNEVMGVITRKDLLSEVLEANVREGSRKNASLRNKLKRNKSWRAHARKAGIAGRILRASKDLLGEANAQAPPPGYVKAESLV